VSIRSLFGGMVRAEQPVPYVSKYRSALGGNFGRTAGNRKAELAQYGEIGTLHGVVSKLAEACEKLGDPLAAKDALELAHAQFPGEESVRRRLRKMYQAAKAYKGWASMLVAEAQGVSDKRQRFELLCNAGDLFRQAEEGALEEARAAYDAATGSMSEDFPDAPDDLGEGWLDWLIYRPLRLEAAALLDIVDLAGGV